MSDFDAVDQLCRNLLYNTAPAARRQIARTVAREVRKSQSARIGQQQNPDGSAFAPRREKPGRNDPRGRLRRQAMFKKLRMARYLKAGVAGDEAWVGFSGPIARIASVHQEGGMDKPAPGMKKVRYARRTLLGLTEAESQRMLDIVLERVRPR